MCIYIYVYIYIFLCLNVFHAYIYIYMHLHMSTYRGNLLTSRRDRLETYGALISKESATRTAIKSDCWKQEHACSGSCSRSLEWVPERLVNHPVKSARKEAFLAFTQLRTLKGNARKAPAMQSDERASVHASCLNSSVLSTTLALYDRHGMQPDFTLPQHVEDWLPASRQVV